MASSIESRAESFATKIFARETHFFATTQHAFHLLFSRAKLLDQLAHAEF